jgi:nitronate monooxygenase
MRSWLDRKLFLAPMAGAGGWALAAAVAKGGGVGALPCAMLSPESARSEVAHFRQAAGAAPLNLNFFVHTPPVDDPARAARWLARLLPYYTELGAEPGAPGASRAPFDATWCALVEELLPEIVSFHFGLPEATLVARVKATRAKVIASATTVEEARWLEAHGVDAVIAQGAEAGGHRGSFLGARPDRQAGTFALVPQVVDAVGVPVIAAGGIGDARGVAAAFALGASAVQVGTAYLFTPEATLPVVHRAALRRASDEGTAITNVLTGRPARGIVNRVMRELGPMADDVPDFPLAAAGLAPLRAVAEARGSGDFQPLWAGQAAPLGRELGAEELTRRLGSP